MSTGLHRLHVAIAWLLVGAIVVQAFLAGVAMSNFGGDSNFAAHAAFGHIAIGLLALALVLTVVAARSGRRTTGLAFGLLVLYFIQASLPELRALVPTVAALHVANALLFFAVALWYAVRALRGVHETRHAVAEAD
jgi:hypothetical protein